MYRNVFSRFPTSPYVNTVRCKAKGILITNPSADVLPYKGSPASNKPIKVNLEAGKTYSWCSCGLSKIQPFCDGAHKNEGISTARPVKFQVSGAPKDLHATRFVNFGDNSPVYEGVARSLGYKPKSGGFQ